MLCETPSKKAEQTNVKVIILKFDNSCSEKSTLNPCNPFDSCSKNPDAIGVKKWNRYIQNRMSGGVLCELPFYANFLLFPYIIVLVRFVNVRIKHYIAFG